MPEPAVFSRVEVFQAQITPRKWFWRLMWTNGRAAATSPGCNEKATALEQARRVAEACAIPVEVCAPCVI